MDIPNICSLIESIERHRKQLLIHFLFGLQEYHLGSQTSCNSKKLNLVSFIRNLFHFYEY
uniref:Uncharacterized protein n=1 Tax=Anguilla anguilla TaxID=7936 RepID=A0A0E9XF61_ANGAN